MAYDMTFAQVLDALAEWEGRDVIVTIECEDIATGHLDVFLATLRGRVGALSMDGANGRGVAFVRVDTSNQEPDLDTPGVQLDSRAVVGGTWGTMYSDCGPERQQLDVQLRTVPAIHVVFTEGDL